MTRTLVVNADDFGLTTGVCEGILRGASDGIVTSTSALVVGPAFARYAGRLASTGIGVGVHLCAVGEDPPLLDAREVPSLVDRRGRFPATWRQFVRRAATGRIDPADLRRELSAQVEVAVGSGVRLTHLDSHQNLHLWPSFAGVLFELAAPLGLRAARCTRTRRRDVTSTGVRVLGARFARSCARHGLVVPEASAGLDEAGHLAGPAMRDAIARLGATGCGTAELATHPGAEHDPERDRYRWGYEWGAELEALCDPSTRAAVAAAGFELGDFGTLVDRSAGAPA